MHLSNDKHDFSAHQVDGDLTADGNCNDLTLSEIKGRVSTNGEIFGEVHMENVTGPVSIHTSMTDVQIAELPGDLTFDSDNLRVNESKGLVHVVTRSKDVDLSQIYGDSYVEDRNGTHLSGAGGRLQRGGEEQQGRRGADAAAECFGHCGWPHAQRRYCFGISA